MLSSSCLCHVNDSCSCLLYEADWSLAGRTSYIMELYEIVKGEIKLSISRAQKPQYPTMQELWSILGKCRPTWPARSMTIMFKGLLKIVFILQHAVTLAWSFKVSKNISPVDIDLELHKSKWSREAALQKFKLKNSHCWLQGLILFCSPEKKGNSKWEWRKCWEGIMISSGFSTSFQTNTAVPEVWWSKLFDLWHKKLLQETISTLG